MLTFLSLGFHPALLVEHWLLQACTWLLGVGGKLINLYSHHKGHLAIQVAMPHWLFATLYLRCSIIEGLLIPGVLLCLFSTLAGFLWIQKWQCSNCEFCQITQSVVLGQSSTHLGHNPPNTLILNLTVRLKPKVIIELWCCTNGTSFWEVLLR